MTIPRVHADGWTQVEKLYDIASIVSELLQSGRPLDDKLLAIAQTDEWTEMLQSLYFYVTRHRAGVDLTTPLAQAVSFASPVRLLMAPPP